jgi:hypothetical protein
VLTSAVAGERAGVEGARGDEQASFCIYLYLQPVYGPKVASRAGTEGVQGATLTPHLLC